MTTGLSDKKILVGVCGSIAAFKVAGWVSELRKEGADVTVVMTKSGSRFVTPLTFAALSGNRVYTDMFDPLAAEEIPHISLAQEHDLILIAPATATTISRLASGLADDLLSTVTLATRAKVLVCPAMNSGMYSHQATVANLEKIKGYGYVVVEPESGSLACGDEGPGRLPDWNIAREAMLAALSPQDLSEQTILVTAGPTREPFDPVRHLSSRSSGRMGFDLARVASRRGARVTLVTGPTSLSDPHDVDVVRVNTASEMYKEVMDRYDSTSVIIKSAAVSDYRPSEVSGQKIKKSGVNLTIKLKLNKDILLELGKRKKKGDRPILVGFAAESQGLLDEGRKKLKEKNLDLIAINDISAPNAGFEVETNRVILLDRADEVEKLPLLSKEETADRILDKVSRMLESE